VRRRPSAALRYASGRGSAGGATVSATSAGGRQSSVAAAMLFHGVVDDRFDHRRRERYEPLGFTLDRLCAESCEEVADEWQAHGREHGVSELTYEFLWASAERGRSRA
jgi:hypothetical protein